MLQHGSPRRSIQARHHLEPPLESCPLKLSPIATRWLLRQTAEAAKERQTRQVNSSCVGTFAVRLICCRGCVAVGFEVAELLLDEQSLDLEGTEHAWRSARERCRMEPGRIGMLW